MLSPIPSIALGTGGVSQWDEGRLACTAANVGREMDGGREPGGDLGHGAKMGRAGSGGQRSLDAYLTRLPVIG